MSEIADAIKEMAKDGREVYSQLCEVIAVNDDDTIDVQPVNGDAEILGVRLCANATDRPFLIVPTLTSLCIVTFLSEAEAYAGMFSDIERIDIRGNEFGGLVKGPELKTQLDKMTARIDGIINALETAAVTLGDGGTTFKANIVASLAALVDLENFDEIENENVKHG